MVKSRYGIHAPDHDFSQAYDLVRIMEIALKNANFTGSLADDRTAIRDAIASVNGYQGLASGPISFCADATLSVGMVTEPPFLLATPKVAKILNRGYRACYHGRKLRFRVIFLLKCRGSKPFCPG